MRSEVIRQVQPLSPFFREIGSGPGVVCLHANASSSSQWRALMDVLAPTFHVLAVDLYGVGKSPAWAADRPLCLFCDTTFSKGRGPLGIMLMSAAVDAPEKMVASGICRECYRAEDFEARLHSWCRDKWGATKVIPWSEIGAPGRA